MRRRAAKRKKLRAPTLRQRLGESRFLAELPRLVRSSPLLRRQPRGTGDPVLTLPGLGFGDSSMAPLRAFLRSRGYRVKGWGLGVNRGNVDRLLPRVVEMTARFADESDAPVHLVGWSLGGLLARETAREIPLAVERIITLGTPVIGGPRYTAAATLYKSRGYDLEAIEAEMERRIRQPLPVPVVAIHARKDGIVDWRACVDPNPGVENIGVSTTHTGLLLNPEVYRIVARRLAEPRSAWREEPAA